MYRFHRAPITAERRGAATIAGLFLFLLTFLVGPTIFALEIDSGSDLLSILSVVDGDEFLDNCELANLNFTVTNTGSGSLTNVRLVTATSPTHPSVSFITSFPAPTSPSNLAPGESATSSFSFFGDGLSMDDTMDLEVEVYADELTSSETATFSVVSTENDPGGLPDSQSNVCSPQCTADADCDDLLFCNGPESCQFSVCLVGNDPCAPLGCDETADICSDLAIDDDSAQLSILSVIDGDEFLDNCEFANLSFTLVNAGVAPHTNVRLITVTSPSHPGISFVTSFPAPTTPSTLAAGETATGAFDLIAEGLSTNDTAVLTVEVTADGLIGAETATFLFHSTENDAGGAPDGQPDACSTQCSVDADCDDLLFCNGPESCQFSVCLVGDDPCDPLGCDESTDTCAVPVELLSFVIE